MTHPLRTVVGGQIWTPRQHLADHTIAIANGKIARLAPTGEGAILTGEGVLHASDAIVLPGLVDMQVNGALGWSFQASDRGRFDEVVAYHLAAGTTTLLPTLVTADEEVLRNSLQMLAAFLEQPAQITLPGIHLEGPFLSHERRGAHDGNALRAPELELMRRFEAAAGGRLQIVTLAPELPGAMRVIEHLARKGVLVAAGHSEATHAEVRRAMDAGLSFVTHAGNASDWPHRRLGDLGFLTSEPGLVGSLMIEAELGGSVILDGYHFHPALLRPLLRLKGPERLVLVSDASTVAGCPPGDYASGGLSVTIHPSGFATSGRGGGWLAGSTITLLQAMQRAVNLSGLSIQEAATMATLGPARWLGLEDRKGQIRVGGDADLIILNEDLSLRHVIAGGRLVATNQSSPG